MADIFVSYSGHDRAIVEHLAAMLEAEGWSVWWDKNLKSADTYRDEIVRELVNARAVIAVWTENSIKSDWVRAEAGRAKSEGKLIPVKVATLEYKDIPLPFGEMHTESLSRGDLIRAAVVVQLAKPMVAPSAMQLATAQFRSQFIMWLGIVGSALNLFVSFDYITRLADWAKWLIEQWASLTHAFWSYCFSWLGFSLPKPWSAVLSFLLFALMTVCGGRISSVWHSRRLDGKLNSETLALPLRWWQILCFSILMYLCAFAVLTLLLSFTGPNPINELIAAIVCFVPLLTVAWRSQDRPAAILFACLFVPFPLLLALVPSRAIFWTNYCIMFCAETQSSASMHAISAFAASFFLTYPFYLLALATVPIGRLNRRFMFILIGLMMLFAISETTRLATVRADILPSRYGTGGPATVR